MKRPSLCVQLIARGGTHYVILTRTHVCAYAVDVTWILRFVHIGVSENRLEMEKPILLNMKRTKLRGSDPPRTNMFV